MALLSYGRAFEWHAERDPDGIAVFFGDRELTRAGLDLERVLNEM